MHSVVNMERTAQHVQCSMASVSGRPERCMVGRGSARYVGSIL